MEDEGFIRIEMLEMRVGSKLLISAPWEELCPAPFGGEMAEATEVSFILANDFWRKYVKPSHEIKQSG